MADPTDKLPDSDLKLKQAAEEIKAVLRKHDIAGVVNLFSGRGHGEYVNHITEPSWSAFEWDARGLRFRVKAKTGGPAEKAKAAATINMIYILRDSMAKTYLMADNLVKMVNQHFDIEEGTLRHTHEGSKTVEDEE